MRTVAVSTAVCDARLRAIIVTSIAAIPIIMAAPTESGAVIQGMPSSLSGHTVQIVQSGSSHCTGVVIDRMHVVTAGHCGRGTVYAAGQAIGIAGVARVVTLDDGTRVQATGDAAILRLRGPVPTSLSPIQTGSGDGSNRYTIAGYGTTNESNRGAIGGLNEAVLVRHGARSLIDPRRSGTDGASACFGDSGGPVVQGSTLVGVITRASHPSPRQACGYLTHYTPLLRVGQGDPSAYAKRKQRTR